MLDIVSLIGQDLTLIRQSSNLYTTQEHDSLKIWVATNSWYHFSRQIGGGPKEWLKYYRSFDDYEAVEYIEANQFSDGNVTALFRNLWNNADIDSGIETRQLHGLKEYHPYIASRNVSETTAKRYNLEIINNSIALPMYNFKGERIGVVLRSTETDDKKQKYRKLFKEKAPLLWPITDWMGIRPGSKVFIFEGAWSAMRFWQVIQDPAYTFLCLFGVATNSELLSYLNGLQNVTFVLDNDDTGRDMGSRLMYLNNSWKLKLPKTYPDEMTDDQIRKFINHCERNTIRCTAFPYTSR